MSIKTNIFNINVKIGPHFPIKFSQIDLKTFCSDYVFKR